MCFSGITEFPNDFDFPRRKVLIDLFQKVAGSKDSVLGRGPQSAKSPLTSKEILFLLLCSYAVTALLDKGEKEELYLR